MTTFFGGGRLATALQTRTPARLVSADAEPDLRFLDAFSSGERRPLRGPFAPLPESDFTTIQPGHLRPLKVEHHDVGVSRRYGLHGLNAVRSFSDDDEIAIEFKLVSKEPSKVV